MKIDRILASNKLFQNLNPSALASLSQQATSLKISKDEYIFKQNENAEHLYILVDGKVTLYITTTTGTSIPIQTLTQPELLGISWLTPPFMWHFDAIADTDVQLISIKGDYLIDHMSNNHEFGYHFSSQFILILSQRLQATRLQLLDVYDK